jgi:hypothetical protein
LTILSVKFINALGCIWQARPSAFEATSELDENRIEGLIATSDMNVTIMKSALC